MRLFQPSQQNGIGANPVSIDVPVIARGEPFGVGAVVEFDFLGQTPSTDAKLGSRASVFSQVRAPTANGTRTGRVHGIVIDNPIRQNREGRVRIQGIVDIYSPNAVAGLKGDPLIVDAADSTHGKRIKGIALSSRADWITALWNGMRGFGNIYTPPSGSSAASGGGSIPSDPSGGGSSGAPSGEPSGASDPGNVIVPD